MKVKLLSVSGKLDILNIPDGATVSDLKGAVVKKKISTAEKHFELYYCGHLAKDYERISDFEDVLLHPFIIQFVELKPTYDGPCNPLEDVLNDVQIDYSSLHSNVSDSQTAHYHFNDNSTDDDYDDEEESDSEEEENLDYLIRDAIRRNYILSSAIENDTSQVYSSDLEEHSESDNVDASDLVDSGSDSDVIVLSK